MRKSTLQQLALPMEIDLYQCGVSIGVPFIIGTFKGDEFKSELVSTNYEYITIDGSIQKGLVVVDLPPANRAPTVFNAIHGIDRIHIMVEDAGPRIVINAVTQYANTSSSYSIKPIMCTIVYYRRVRICKRRLCYNTCNSTIPRNYIWTFENDIRQNNFREKRTNFNRICSSPM